MIRRRITGGCLAAILLLTIALPAMCGQCHVAAAEPSCAENHKPAAHSHHGAVASIQTICKSCANDVAVSGVRDKRKAPGAALNSAGCAANSCQANDATDVLELSATPALSNRFERSQYVADVSDRLLISNWATHASDPPTFSNLFSFSTSEQNLSLTLKI